MSSNDQTKDAISRATSVGDIIAILATQGCPDLTEHINWAKCGNFPIAGGGFCDVFRGELHDNTRVAIKSLRIFDAPGQDSYQTAVLRDAAKELYHWSKLRHPNVLPLMGLVIHRGQISMVSEWMNSGNLSRYLIHNPGVDRLALCRGVCAGLHYIHSQGMVHGDMKAGNVMVSREGIAMIADFGNARLKELTVQFTGTTNYGVSLRWAAPELLTEEHRKPSIHSDIYAFGMTILETLTGEIPFKSMNDFQLTFQLSQGKAKPSRPTSGISDSVWVILDLCWSRSPEARPSLPTIAEHLSSHSLSHGYDPRLPDFDQASELGIAEVLNGGTSLPSSTPPSYQPGAHSFNTGRSTPHVSLEPTPSLNRSHTPNPPPNGESSDHLLVPVPVRSNHHFSPRESVTPPTDISRPPVEPSYSLEEEAISHASTSLNIDVVPSRTMSSLAIVTDGASTDAQGDGESQDDTYRTDSPTSMFHEDSSSGSLGVNGQSEKRKLSDLGRGNEEPIPEHAPLSVNTRSSPPITVNPPSAVPTIQDSSSSTADAEHTRHTPNAKFKALTKRVIHTFRVGPQYQAPSSLPVRSILSSSVMSDSRHRQDSSEHDLTPTDIQTYVPILRTLRSSQLLTEHVALVKHLQFSPGGQFLATCSWDRTALIWRVGAGPQGEFELMHKLVHTTWVGGFIGQVDWSPDGEQLLTKQLKSIKVWSSKNGVCERTIDRKRIVQAITWMPKGSRFLSIEWKMGSSQAEKRVHHTENILGSDLVVVGTDGVLHQAHHLPRLQVWDAAVMPNEKRLVAVATLHRSEQDHRTAKSRSEKRILIYNLRTQEIENQVSLWHEVRDVTLTEEGNFALVSYENKAPPQAWFLEKVLREGKQRLVLAHTYSTQNPVDFAGPSYFGGLRDTLVLAASKSGEIYIWERWSGLLLHSLKAPDQELTNLAWNRKTPSGYMFASATHDGMVRIWTTTAAAPPRTRFPSPGPQEIGSPRHLRQEYTVANPPASARMI